MQYSSILFYKFFPVSEPEMFRLWQRELCRRLELKGRIIVSPHGINAALAGDVKNLKAYLKESYEWPLMKKCDVKWSHNIDHNPFPKLTVKTREELVTFNYPQLKVNEEGVVNTGTHLNPDQFHKLLASVAKTSGLSFDEIVGKEILMLDGRNDYEYNVGRFKNSLDSKVKDAKGFQGLIDSGLIDEWKDKPVITYCTGGVRCEILTPILKQNGFTQVYQLDGGIVSYIEESKNDHNLWEGSIYTFDTRMKIMGEYSEVVGTCVHCVSLSDNHHNCRNCGDQILACDYCWKQYKSCVKCRES